VLAIVVVTTIGCDGQRGSGGSRTITNGAHLTVRADEYVFRPQDVTVRGTHFRVTVVNEGDLAHNWRIYRPSDEQFRHQLGGTETFQRGSRTVSVRLRPGTYRIVCTVGNHEDLGMEGKLRVKG
jgi:plastocyanin